MCDGIVRGRVVLGSVLIVLTCAPVSSHVNRSGLPGSMLLVEHRSLFVVWEQLGYECL